MKERLDGNAILAMMQKLAKDIETAREELTNLDAAIGDGDLGMTLVIGFREITKALAELKAQNISTVLITAAEAFAEKAASTFGTLLTTMLLYSGKVAVGMTDVGVAEAAKLLRAAADGVQKRGKAQRGDKTLLDALIPAVEAMEDASSRGLSLPEAAKQTLEAAQNGAERTIDMRARIGRSGYLGERTIGVKDPGAAAIVVILKSMTEFVVAD